jgi:DNA-directed RNA polymerase specialized sigma24 family protein
MGLSAQVAPHLPYLRRFARALSGSQDSGDAYVAALLQAAIADPSILTHMGNVKLALYAGLCRMWGAVSVNGQKDTSVPGWEASVSERLGNLPGAPRQVFVLSAIEGLSLEDIAKVMNIGLESVKALRVQASDEIAHMLTSDILIIEDEPLIAMDIEEIVKSLGHNCVGIARTRDEALRLAKDRRPQIVLSDIQLADGSSGIDAVNDILKMFDVPVIFITAFPERLLTGDKPEPAFLITKPFSPDMVKAVIAQALFFDVKSKKAA